MALNSLFCADVLLSNFSLGHFFVLLRPPKQFSVYTTEHAPASLFDGEVWIVLQRKTQKIYDSWRRLIKGLLLRQKLREKFDVHVSVKVSAFYCLKTLYSNVITMITMMMINIIIIIIIISVICEPGSYYSTRTRIIIFKLIYKAR